MLILCVARRFLKLFDVVVGAIFGNSCLSKFVLFDLRFFSSMHCLAFDLSKYDMVFYVLSGYVSTGFAMKTYDLSNSICPDSSTGWIL